MWHCWIYGIVEWNEIVKLDNTTELELCWICGTVECDMNEKLYYTTEFVTLLNMWDCWMRYESEIR